MINETREHGVNRLIHLLIKEHSDDIDNIAQEGNSRNSFSITFKDGEVLVLTADDEVARKLETQNFI
jgi:hypothetical protein